jgi:hypothetical protein
LQRLAQDLNAKFSRGFPYPNVNKFRQFYLAFPSANILSTPSIESILPSDFPPCLGQSTLSSQQSTLPLFTNHRSRITGFHFPVSRGIHKRAEIRSDPKKGNMKNGGDGVSAIIEGKNYELIRRNESRYRRGNGFRLVDRGRDGSRVAKAASHRKKFQSILPLETSCEHLSRKPAIEFLMIANP